MPLALNHKPARILLERPLALGEMRANVFVARSQVDYLVLFGVLLMIWCPLGPHPYVGGGMPPPLQGGGSSLVLPRVSELCYLWSLGGLSGF